MPTFKSYVSKAGYYIKARPSNIGNITYQVDQDAAKFILDLGYNADDELPWGIIKPLRVAGLIYTNSQGVSEDDKGVPSLDPSKLPTLSDRELRELLAYLEARGDIAEDILKLLRYKLNGQVSDSTIISEAISKELGKQAEVHINRSKKRESDYGSVTIEVTYETTWGFPLPNMSNKRKISHRISASRSPGVDEWGVTHPYGDNWSGLAKATEEKIPIISRSHRVRGSVCLDVV